MFFPHPGQALKGYDISVFQLIWLFMPKGYLLLICPSLF